MWQGQALDVIDLELLMWNGIFSTSEGLLALGYVVCMFLTTTYRPQQIGSIGLFRLSYILFGLYLVIPGVSQMVLSILQMEAGPGRPLGGPLGPGGGLFAPAQDPTGLSVFVLILGTIGKVVFCFAIVCGLASLRHYPTSQEAD